MSSSIPISDAGGEPVILQSGRATLGSFYAALWIAMDEEQEIDFATFKEQALDKRFIRADTAIDLPGKLEGPAPVGHGYRFTMDGVGEGELILGFQPSNDSSGVGDWVYTALCLFPKGSRMPLFGNLKKNVRKVASTTGTSVKQHFGIPEKVLRSDMPWRWKSSGCAFECWTDSTPAQYFTMYNLRHIAPFANY